MRRAWVLAGLALFLTLVGSRPALAQQQNIEDNSAIYNVTPICDTVNGDDGCSLQSFAWIYGTTSAQHLDVITQTSVTLDSYDDGWEAYVCGQVTKDGQSFASGCAYDDGTTGVAAVNGALPITLSATPNKYVVNTNSYYSYFADGNGGCGGTGACYFIVSTTVNVTLGSPGLTSVSPPYVFVGTNGLLTLNGTSMVNPFVGGTPTSLTTGLSGGTGFSATLGSIGLTQGTASYNAALTATTGKWTIGLSYYLGDVLIHSSNFGGFTVGDPTPSISSVSPNLWTAGQSNISVVIKGSGFGSNPALVIAGATSSITSHSDTGQPGGAVINANVSVPLCATGGSVAVTVTSLGYNGSGFGAAYVGQSPSGAGTATVQAIPPPAVSMSRNNLTQTSATGSPTGGSFRYAVSSLNGTSIAGIAFAPGVTTTTNPNTANLIDPTNPNKNGSPSPGGLANIQTTYADSCSSANDSFHVPTFGMSCYYTTLESDWGTVPNNCCTVTINGVKYSGTVTNPYGLAGTYCNAFIAEVKLQGSGVLNGGSDVQYNAGKITKVTQILGADGTAVVANKTVARDRSIIPKGGIHVDIDKIGTGLLANDTGGAILGYRVDFYKGAGKAVCSNFNNIISVSACSPGNANCPVSTIH